MVNQCSVCKKKITGKSKGILCSGKCRCSFHVRCGGVSVELFEALKKGEACWRCPKCSSNSNESFVIEDEDVNDIEIIDEEEDLNETSTSNGYETQLVELEELSSFDPTNCNMDKMAAYFKVLGSVVIEIRKSVALIIDDMCKQNLAIKKENKLLKKRIAVTEETNNNLDFRINKLESLLDQPKQQSLKNNIVLAGLPEMIVNPTGTILEIAKKINANINKDDICNISAIQSRRENVDKKSSLYILELNSEKAKSELLQKKRIYKHLYTLDVNLETQGNNEIFFRHHLSSLQAKLYHEAKQIKLSCNLQYLWVKNSEIFLRANQTSKVYKISSYNDINFIKNILTKQKQL